MENEKKKCSTSKHANIDAILYCPECKKYICHKCQNFHSEFFEDHIPINLDKNDNGDDLFINICEQKNHNNKLEFYCKNHNTLCCGLCCTKIKNDIYGQHKDCEICSINEIKEEKKNKLKENIKLLENLSKNFEKSFDELKVLLEKINEDKEKYKINIQKKFTEIRNCLNEKEDQLLSLIDEYYNSTYFKGDIIKETEKLPKKIKLSLKIGENIEKKWDDNNLSLMLNNCINIEKNIKDINKINECIEKFHSNDNKKIIFELDDKKINDISEKIKNLEIKKDFYEDFNIELKNPIHILNSHTSNIYCITILKDGRLASGGRDNSIIIYNEVSFKPDIIIKEHKNCVLCLIQLISGILASCSRDNTIILFNINGKNYQKIQTLTYHTNEVYKIIETKNNMLISCSEDKNIIFYIKEDAYKKDYQISIDKSCYCVIQVKDNEICFSDSDDKIYFFDLNERKIKATVSNLNKVNNIWRTWLLMISKDLLIIPGKSKLTVVNVNEYSISRIIDVANSSNFYGICLLNQKMILAGDEKGTIFQFKIEGDNLILTSKKEKAHNSLVNFLLNMGDGFVASGSDDITIKIW